MGLFNRKKTEQKAGVPQIRNDSRHPFSQLNSYVPLGGGDIRLYRAIREAFPVVDAAILKLIRLTGGFTILCENKQIEYQLNEFVRMVNVGRGQRSLHSFLDGYLDSLLTCGRAVGEIVLTSTGRDIAAVLCGNVEDVEVREGGTAIDFELCGREQGGIVKPLPYQNLLLFTPFNPEADNPYGVSLLRSMPFLAEILLKIYHSIGINWDRAGNIRYSVVYKPQGTSVDNAYAHERSQQIAREWSAAMQDSKNGTVRDFVSVGDVDIRVIGADGPILDSEVPVRQILEQLIARTGIPPFMLGLNWSTTERMSSQQADLLTSELTAIRRCVTPVVERICELKLRLEGHNAPFSVEWDDINLQDQVEEARAALYRGQAETLLVEAHPTEHTKESGDS